MLECMSVHASGDNLQTNDFLIVNFTGFPGA